MGEGEVEGGGGMEAGGVPAAAEAPGLAEVEVDNDTVAFNHILSLATPASFFMLFSGISTSENSILSSAFLQ